MRRALEQQCGTGEGIDVPPTVTKLRLLPCWGAIFGGIDPAMLLGAPWLLRCVHGCSESGLACVAMEASIAIRFSRSRLLPGPQATSHRPPALAVSMVAQATHSHKPPRPLHTSDDGGSRRGARGAAEHATYQVRGLHQHLSMRQNFQVLRFRWVIFLESGSGLPGGMLPSPSRCMLVTLPRSSAGNTRNLRDPSSPQSLNKSAARARNGLSAGFRFGYAHGQTYILARQE